jgi:hypothetical protein
VARWCWSGITVVRPFRVAGASLARPCSVSTPRSSNRTCGFPASGFRRRRHGFALAAPYRGAVRSRLTSPSTRCRYSSGYLPPPSPCTLCFRHSHRRSLRRTWASTAVTSRLSGKSPKRGPCERRVRNDRPPANPHEHWAIRRFRTLFSPVNSRRETENKFEEGYDRGAFQTVTELTDHRLTERPRERALAGFVVFRQCLQGLTTARPRSEGPESGRERRTSMAAPPLGRETLTLSVSDTRAS